MQLQPVEVVVTFAGGKAAPQLRIGDPSGLVEVGGAAGEFVAGQQIGETVRGETGLPRGCGDQRRAALEETVQVHELGGPQIRASEFAIARLDLPVVFHLVGGKGVLRAREGEFDLGQGAGPVKGLVVGDQCGGESEEWGERFEDPRVVGPVVVILLLVMPEGPVFPVPIREKVQGGFERLVQGAGPGVITLVAKTVVTLGDVTVGVPPVARTDDIVHRERTHVPRRQARLRAAENRGERHGLAAATFVGQHQAEPGIGPRRYPKRHFRRVHHEGGVALRGGQLGAGEPQEGFRHEMVELLQ